MLLHFYTAWLRTTVNLQAVSPEWTPIPTQSQALCGLMSLPEVVSVGLTGGDPRRAGGHLTLLRSQHSAPT